MKPYLGVLAVFAGVAAGDALAESGSDNVAMAPYLVESLNYTFADSSRRSEDGVGGYLGGNLPLSRHFSVEVGGGYTHFNRDDSRNGPGPWEEYNLHGEGQFVFSRNPVFSPYLAIGAGGAAEFLHADRDSGRGVDHAFSTEAGLGAIHYFKIFDTDFGVRADARYRWTFVDENKFPGAGVNRFEEPVLSLGLVIPFKLYETEAEPYVSPYPPVQLPPPPPAEVVESATAPPPTLDLDMVHFGFDRSDLDASARSTLDSDLEQMKQFDASSLQIDVAGHTDSIGSTSYNHALSERRAVRVREYLVKHGVPAAHVKVHAFGESQPAESNRTRKGRAYNRRAEIRASGNK